MDPLNQLKQHLQEVVDLEAAKRVLDWDQSTYMPHGGGETRARQMALLSKLAHEKFTDPVVGNLLDSLQSVIDERPDDDDDVRLVQVTRRDYERALRVPAEFMAEVAGHTATTYAAWAAARPANDFAAVRPLLEQTLAYSRRYAAYFPEADHPADPLIDMADPGMTVATIRPIFEELRQALVPLVDAIGRCRPVDSSCLRQFYAPDKQWGFGLEILHAFGYDFQRGRQDRSPHPFSIRLSGGDVRITTRVDEHRLDEALFGTLHECGHALYELGVAPELDATPLAEGTSSGVHESQSRLWENQVGRSRQFWQYYYPALQAVFPEQLAGVSLDQFYAAVNKVQPSLIRTDADEVTYNLHVIIRFGLELDLLEGNLSIDDLPAAWHARYQENLGVRAPDDRDGVLQDVHWFGGFIGGAFQGYTLGNIMAAQFYGQALAAHPAIPAEIAAGNFGTLHRWLRNNIYAHGRKFTADELLQRVTGDPLRLEPYLTYLHTKFGAIYGL